MLLTNAEESALKSLPPDAGEIGGVEYFPGATREEIGSIMMQDVVGSYETPDQVPEWAWVKSVASFNHGHNGSDGVWEFVVNLSLDLGDIPKRLQPLIVEARTKNLAYVIFHQGT